MLRNAHTIATIVIALVLAACGAARTTTVETEEERVARMLEFVDRDATEAASAKSGLIAIGLILAKHQIILQNFLPKKNCVEAPGCNLEALAPRTEQDGVVTYQWPNGNILQRGNADPVSLNFKLEGQDKVVITIVGTKSDGIFTTTRTFPREEIGLYIFDVKDGTLLSQLEYSKAHPEQP